MKKILFPLIALIASTAFGQINLKHNFSSNYESVAVGYVKNSVYYAVLTKDNKLELYNHDMILYKTILIPNTDLPSTSSEILITDKLFNHDDLIEVLILTSKKSGGNNVGDLMLINENSQIIKKFGSASFYVGDLYKVLDGKYELKLQSHHDRSIAIYTLPGTLTLAQEELILKQKNASFPNPATTSINISNSVKGKRGSYNLEVLSTNGATVLKKSVQAGDQDYISLDISGLTPGVYFYQLDQTKGKFIKK